jgi:hypothetical protein
MNGDIAAATGSITTLDGTSIVGVSGERLNVDGWLSGAALT